MKIALGILVILGTCVLAVAALTLISVEDEHDSRLHDRDERDNA